MNITIKNTNKEMWQKIIRSFVHGGDSFEIRCWEGENEEFAKKWADEYQKEDIETVYFGKVTGAFLKAFFGASDENGITPFFSVGFEMNGSMIYSEKYGEELHILNIDAKDEQLILDAGASGYEVY